MVGLTDAPASSAATTGTTGAATSAATNPATSTTAATAASAPLVATAAPAPPIPESSPQQVAGTRPASAGQRPTRPAAARAGKSTKQKRKSKSRALIANADALACIAATGVSWAATALAPGDPIRVLLVLPAILFVPGYLALQAVSAGSPRQMPRDPRRHALLALGLSPALVALIALATAVAPGGFRLEVIASSILVSCLLLAAAVLARRILGADKAARPPTGTERAKVPTALPATQEVQAPVQQPLQPPMQTARAPVQFIMVRPQGPVRR